MPLDYDDSDDDDDVEIEVETPSGGLMPVASAVEASFYERLRDKITEEFEFTISSDLSDLDRILSMELTVWRMARQVTKSVDLHGRPLLPIDQTRLQASLNQTQTVMAKLKDDLGLSKTARDKASDGDSVSGYLENLRLRAGEFGVMRNKQAQLAIALLQEVISISDTWQRANALERHHLGYETAEDVLFFITNTIKEQFDQIDRSFVQENQRYWIETI